MSSFRRYGGLNYSSNNTITRSHISNNEQMNIINYSGQQNSKETFASNIDLSGNSLLHTGTVYFQDGTSMSTASTSGNTGINYIPGIGLYSTQDGPNNYLNVDSSLNFLYSIDASDGETLDVATQSLILNLGSSNTSVNIAGNSYIYTPHSLGSTFSPQTLNITSSSNSTKIIFTWTIPTLYQNISSSFQNISATLYANISGQIKTYQILNNNSNNITSLNEIIITNQSSSNDFINSTTYNYYNVDFNNMESDASNNQLILWYTNYSPYPNVSYAGYSSFESIGVPSAVVISSPSNVQSTVDSSFNVTNGSVTLECSVTYVNSSDPSAPAPPNIVQYQSPTGYYTTSGSSSRYPGPFNTQQSTQDVSCNTAENVETSFQFLNMYPDSSYNFSIHARNASNANYGPFNNPAYTYSTLTPSYPNSTFKVPSLLFNSSGKKYTYLSSSYFFVGTTNQVSSDIINYNNISSGFVSNDIITAVQANGTYGKNSLSSSLNVSASLNSTTTSLNVTSFGTGPTFTSTSGGITATSKTFDAYYKGDEYNQGFYLDCSTNMVIENTYNFNIPTSSLFTASLTETGNGVNPSSNYTFYIDDLNVNPTFNSISSFTLNSNSPTNDYYSNLVSGIWVLNQSQTPVFSVTNLKLNDMGDYFYVTPLVNYTFSEGVSGTPQESNTTNVTNISGGKFENTINITNTGLASSSVSSSYSKNILLNITFNNLFGQGSSSSLPTIYVICDQPSYNLITNVLSTTIQNLGTSTTGYKGFRVWSANVNNTMTPTEIVPYPYIVSGTAIPNNTATGTINSSTNQGYVNISYNNIWNISNNTVTNQELLIANGRFTTSSSYYLNYGSISSVNGNTFNYTGLTNTGNNGLKFATFAWNLNKQSSYSTSSVNMNFTLNLSSTIYYQSTTGTWYFDTNFTKPLYLFYRFEYTGNVTNWGQSEGNYYPNTAWVSINTFTSNAGNNVINICDISNIKNVYYLAATTNASSPASGLITFIASRPTVDINDYQAILYLRIGIPNGYDGFSSVSCYLSS